MRRCGGKIGVLLVLAVLGTGTVASGQRMAPALEGTADSHRVRVLTEEVSRGDGSSARAWVALRDLQRGGESVVVTAEGGAAGVPVVEGLGSILRQFEGPKRRSLLQAAAEDEDLKAQWTVLREGADLAEVLAFARRAGPTALGAEAIEHAATMVEARGDADTAGALQQRARSWRNEASVHLPAVEAGTGTWDGPANDRLRRVLVEYWWMNKLPDRLGGTRCVVGLWGPAAGEPVDGSDRWVLTSPTHVVAMQEGKVVWVWQETPPAGPSKTPVDDLAMRLEFPVFGSVLVGSDGGEGVVLARVLGRGGAVLRGLRSGDGQELWSSEAVADWQGMHVASMPAVAGSWGYVLAADVGGASAAGGGSGRVWLVAFEAVSGRVLFRTPIGALAEGLVAGRGRMARGGGRSPGLWDEQTAPLIDGDRVVVVAGGGVFAVDRFDGQLLRGTGYATTAGVSKEGNSPSELPMSRWQSSPVVWGDLVVAGPRDADAILAWDRRTLVPAWVSPRMGAYTVVGVSAGQLIVQGNELCAVSATDGKRLWQTAPRTQSRFTGPAVLIGETIVVPTSTGTMAMTARSGQWLPSVPVDVTELSAWLAGESSGVLRATDVLATFYSPSQVVQQSRRDDSGTGRGVNRGPERIVPGPKPANVNPGNQSPPNMAPPPIDARPDRKP